MERLPTIATALDAYLVSLETAMRPRPTILTYTYLLTALRDDRSILDFDQPYCTALLADRVRRHQSPATVQTLHGSLSAFAKYCVRQGWLQRNPLLGIPCPRVNPRPHRYLSKDELKAIWAAADDPETRLILLLLMEGLRATELVSLRWKDVRATSIMVVYAKGGSPRQIPLSDAVRTFLDARTRTAERIIPITTATLRNRLHRLGKAAAVPGLHPHLFRHTFASHFLLEGGIESIEALRILAGWTKGSTMPMKYAKSVIEDTAMARAREINLSARLFGSPGDRL